MRKIKQNYSGNILFTVICIMSIITILLMSSIIIIASSNKKAVKNYADNQVYVSAKSLLDTFVDCATDTTLTSRITSYNVCYTKLLRIK